MGKEEENNAGKARMRTASTALLARGAKRPFKEMDKERQAVYV